MLHLKNANRKSWTAALTKGVRETLPAQEDYHMAADDQQKDPASLRSTAGKDFSANRAR